MRHGQLHHCFLACAYATTHEHSGRHSCSSWAHMSCAGCLVTASAMSPIRKLPGMHADSMSGPNLLVAWPAGTQLAVVHKVHRN